MGEFLVELLLAFAELLFEVLFEFAVEALLDLALRAIAKVFDGVRFTNPVVASASYTLLGALAGGLSLIIFPHPLVQPSRLHGISLLASPVITGFVMSLIGSTLSRRGKTVTQIESFGYGFGFAFGMALIRFFFVV
jgi:hypothetical protein